MIKKLFFMRKGVWELSPRVKASYLISSVQLKFGKNKTTIYPFILVVLFLSTVLSNVATWSILPEKELEERPLSRTSTSAPRGVSLHQDEDRSCDSLQAIFFTGGLSEWDRDSIKEMMGNSGERELALVVTFIASICGQRSTGLERSWIIDTVGKIFSRRDLVSVATLAPSLFTENMSGLEKLQVSSELEKIRSPLRRTAVQQATLGLIVRGSTSHDILCFLSAFKQLAETVSIPNRIMAVEQALDRDRESGNLTETNRFSRTIELIHNPDSPFTVANSVRQQEALMEKREGIYKGWRRLTKLPQFARLILSQEDASKRFPEVMDYLGEILRHRIERKELSPSERFRVQTAQEAMAYVRRISPHFKPRHDMPTLAQCVVTLYNALKEDVTGEDYINGALHRDYEILQKIFPELMGNFDTVGLFMASRGGKDFVTGLLALLKGEDSGFVTQLTQKGMRWIKKLAQDKEFVVFTPMVEALFMANRGHCFNLMDEKERHKTACADGVVLNFMRAFSEILRFQKDTEAMQGISQVVCI